MLRMDTLRAKVRESRAGSDATCDWLHRSIAGAASRFPGVGVLDARAGGGAVEARNPLSARARRQRPAEVIPLRKVAPGAGHDVHVPIGFDSLGNNLQFERMRH